MAKGNKLSATLHARLRTYLREHEMRPSAVRRMVLDRVLLLPQPFSAEQLVLACREERISKGTVYNALNLFVLAQILRKYDRQLDRAAAEYEVISGSTIRMKAICQKCGRITDFHDKAIERLIKEHKYSNFTMLHISLYVHGECKLCRRKLEKNKV